MKEEQFKKILMLIGIIFMVIFCLFPFIYMLIVSISTKPDFLSYQVPFIFTLQNYAAVITDRTLHFLDYLRNSIIISLISAGFGVFIASLAAYAITHFHIRGKMYLLFFILAVSIFPQISMVGYLFKFMTKLNWINTYRALVLPYIAWVLPLSVWILVSYFSQIPRDLDKAALVDGCTYWQVLRKVIFPVARPGIFSVFLLSFIFTFNEFMFALMLTTNYNARTVPVGIALFQGLHGEIPWGSIMAAAAVTTLPVVLVTMIFQRHIIGGLTRGAVKG